MDLTPLYLRGTAVDATRRFIFKRRDHPDWDRFWEQLTPDQRHAMEGNVRPKQWYLVPDHAAVLALAAQHLAPDEQETFLTDIGRFVMDDGVTTIYRMFFRVISPSFVIRLSSLFWFQFYKGSKLKILHRERKRVQAVVVDASFCSVPLCHTIKGGMLAALENAGARRVVVDHHACKSTSNKPACEYYFSWW